MIDIKKILSLPPAERDDEIRKLIVPKPWKHIREDYLSGVCEKCGAVAEETRKKTRLGIIPVFTYSDPTCPIPDRIPLDWNLAMKMRDEVVGKVGTVKYYEALEQICPYEDKSIMGFWVSIYGFPHHYILAAVLAKQPNETPKAENDKEKECPKQSKTGTISDMM